MSSGKYKAHRGFNAVQIKNGFIVRLNKNGTVRSILDKYPKEKKWTASTSTALSATALAHTVEEILTRPIGIQNTHYGANIMKKENIYRASAQ